MKTLKKYSLLGIVLVLTFIAFLAACKKSTSIKEKTKTELLTDSVWKFSLVGIDQNNDDMIDYPLPTAVLPVCEADNMFTFKADSTGTMDEGKEKCTSTASQKTPFTWHFSNNETEFTSSLNIIPLLEGSAQIVQLNETTFTLSKVITVFGYPTPLKVVAILIH